VQGVGTAATVASGNFSVLENQLAALTGAATANTAALDSFEGVTDRVAGSTTRLAGGACVATAELKILEGNLPITAAGRLLTQFEGLQAVMQAAFPVFGIIALANRGNRTARLGDC